MYVIDCYGGRQLTTFNKQARVLVGAARNKFGKITRPFHGIIAGLLSHPLFELRDTHRPSVRLSVRLSLFVPYMQR